jgi:hypothetical protein
MSAAHAEQRADGARVWTTLALVNGQGRARRRLIFTRETPAWQTRTQRSCFALNCENNFRRGVGYGELFAAGAGAVSGATFDKLAPAYEHAQRLGGAVSVHRGPAVTGTAPTAGRCVPNGSYCGAPGLVDLAASYPD